VQPDSGTASRTRVNNVISGISRGAGAVLGSLGGRAAGMHDAVEPLLIAENMAPALFDPLVRAGARAVTTSRPAQYYLGNQATRGQADPYRSLQGLLTALQSGRQ
jgi:hypothetical protein